MRGVAAAALVSLVAACAARIDPSRPIYPMPQTRAEATNYNQTSTYGDVIAFVNGLRSRNAPIAFGVIGKTTEGRDIPYMIASRPLVTTPEQAKNSDGQLFTSTQTFTPARLRERKRCSRSCAI